MHFISSVTSLSLPYPVDRWGNPLKKAGECAERKLYTAPGEGLKKGDVAESLLLQSFRRYWFYRIFLPFPRGRGCRTSTFHYPHRVPCRPNDLIFYVTAYFPGKRGLEIQKKGTVYFSIRSLHFLSGGGFEMHSELQVR
ncbi:Hypothetical protein NTJ_11992 [Nesidiocoris tenuis]|uniref:Uncharacterized protein n=1 Tax=Nesidiocoris tenuis TaxID=355587 RepID=A0ABN7B448_9HEMI|nr:Hypothetical protein NTJ_11992 [Nesidiocoris tenuis]